MKRLNITLPFLFFRILLRFKKRYGYSFRKTIEEAIKYLYEIDCNDKKIHYRHKGTNELIETIFL